MRSCTSSAGLSTPGAPEALNEVGREEWEVGDANPVERREPRTPVALGAVALSLGVAAAAIPVSGLYLVYRNGSPDLPWG